MEGAIRIFAGEFDQADLSLPAEDDRTSAWVVTPSGAYCRQLFLAGALVSVQDNGGMLSARLADPTGGFDLQCSSTAPADILRRIAPPVFVSVTGRAQLFRRDGRISRTVRVELVHLIDRITRDRWVVTTAAATLDRLAEMQMAVAGRCDDARVRQACSHYALTPGKLDQLAEMVAGALGTVQPSGEIPEEQEPGPDPPALLLEMIGAGQDPRGISVEAVLDMAGSKGISREAALAAIESLIMDDEIYQPRKGFVRLL